MDEKLSKTIHDRRDILPKGSLTLAFRPGGPGEISILSKTAIINPRPKKGGDLGDKSVSLERKIELFRPEYTKPVAAVNGGPPDLATTLSYTVSSTDLNSARDWACRVTNLSSKKGIFISDITFPSGIESLSATFNHGLLNQLLYQALGAFGLKIHLASSSTDADMKSYISWSSNITEILNVNDLLFLELQALLRGNGLNLEKEKCWFYIPDFDSPVGKLRLKDLNTYTDFRGPNIRVGTSGNVFIEISTAFETEGTEVERLEFGGGGIDLEFLRVDVSFSVPDGFPKVNCNASVVTDPATPLQLSNLLCKELQANIIAILNRQEIRFRIREGILGFFKRLMRLGEGACIDSIRIDPYLIISYHLDPTHPCP